MSQQKKDADAVEVVWSGSSSLGIGVAMPTASKAYVVANYDPPGNVRGAFPENVQPPK